MTEILLNIEPSKKGFGFYLIEDPETETQRISKIVPEGPADISGLKEGDKVLMIDECDIAKLPFKKAVKKIKKNKKNLRLKILRHQEPSQEEETSPETSPETDNENSPQMEEIMAEQVVQEFDENLERTPQINIAQDYEEVDKSSSEQVSENARLCHITIQDSSNFGFTLVRNKDCDHSLISNVITGSPAVDAGVKDGDIVIQVNDTKVEGMEHDKVVELIKSTGDSVNLLVVDQSAYDYFYDRRVTICSDMDCIEYCRNFVPVGLALEECQDMASYKSLECVVTPEPVIHESLPDDVIKLRDQINMRRGKPKPHSFSGDISNLVSAISKM